MLGEVILGDYGQHVENVDAAAVHEKFILMIFFTYIILIPFYIIRIIPNIE